MGKRNNRKPSLEEIDLARVSHERQLRCGSVIQAAARLTLKSPVSEWTRRFVEIMECLHD